MFHESYSPAAAATQSALGRNRLGAFHWWWLFVGTISEFEIGLIEVFHL
jgi:hypothetical protein